MTLTHDRPSWESMRHDVAHALAHEQRAYGYVSDARRWRVMRDVTEAIVERDAARERWVAALRCLLELCR